MAAPLRPERGGHGLSRARRESAFLKACRLDVIAFKPGNVSLRAPGHGMQATDFLVSAAVAVPALCAPGQRIGARIEQAVTATWRVVRCNTNLGIILLLAPLALASEQGMGDLELQLTQVLSELDLDDSRHCFRAVRRARPAGLGRSATQDIDSEPTLALREVMALSAGHDRIALQYANGFADVLHTGVPHLLEYRARWHSLAWATTVCFLVLLAEQPDSHIVRKHDLGLARAVSARAGAVAKVLKACENPRTLAAEIAAFDRELKTKGINPGTTADLTVASLAAMLLQQRTWHE